MAKIPAKTHQPPGGESTVTSKKSSTPPGGEMAVTGKKSSQPPGGESTVTGKKSSAQNPPQNYAQISPQNSSPYEAAIAPQIAELVALLPPSPGVYLYYAGEKLLYVGKAKSLRARVRSYFAFTPRLRPSPRVNLRIASMLAQATRLSYHLAPSELDALVLENSLIKQLRPKFNILLRDDKTYPYIALRGGEWPRLEITRRITREGRYFGPYASGAKALLEAIYAVFKIRQKASCKKRCVFAQIGRCLAPCEAGAGDEKAKNEYARELKAAVAALKNPRKLLPLLEAKMLEHAEAERFEQAAALRDQMAAISRIASTSSELDLARDVSFDAIAVVPSQQGFCAVRLVVVNGRVISVLSHSAAGASEEEFLRAYLQSAYKILAPKMIYLAKEFADAPLLEQLLSQRAQHAVKIRAAKSADVRALLAAAAQEASKSAAAWLISADKAAIFADVLGLSRVCERIEVFDNSMHQGAACVGAMVVYENGWRKEDYRKFTLAARSDYEQMREVLSRRIARFSESPPPDLWLLDGGAALLALAQKLLADAGVQLEVAAIAKEKLSARAHRAKGAARDVLHSAAGEFRLASTHPALQFAQMLRDEAHRFAIATHRALKRRQDMASSRFAAAGVSAAQLAKLLKYFGTHEAILAASDEELAAVCSARTASKIAALREK